MMMLVSRRRPRTRIGPIEAALSALVSYLFALVLVPLTVWDLFLWQRPDDPGGAMIYAALQSDFWRFVAWIVLAISVVVVIVPIAGAVVARVTAGRS